MFTSWDLQFQQSFSKSFKKIDWLIDLISSIRSTKSDLNVPPGSFIDISIQELSSNKMNIIKDNLSVLKRLGRVTNISYSKSNKNGVEIIVSGDTITLYFDQNIDLREQKQKLSNKINDLKSKTSSIEAKLKNKSFLKNAPKHIISRDKKALVDHEVELKKLNSIINSIRN